VNFQAMFEAQQAQAEAQGQPAPVANGSGASGIILS
jgi:hypothetical protein